MLLLLLLLFVLLLSLLFLLFLVIKVEQQKNNKVERGKSKTQFPSQKMVPLSQNPNNKENPAIKQGQAAGERYASTPCDLTHLGLTAGGPFIQKQTRLRFPEMDKLCGCVQETNPLARIRATARPKVKVGRVTVVVVAVRGVASI